MSWQDDPLRMAALVYIIKRRKNYDIYKFADTDTGLLQMCASKKLQRLWQAVKSIPKKDLLDRLTEIDEFYSEYFKEWPIICVRFYSRSKNVKRSLTWTVFLIEPFMEYDDVFAEAMKYKTIPILKSLEQNFKNPDVQKQYRYLKSTFTNRPDLLRKSFMKNFLDTRSDVFRLADYVMMGIFLKCVDYCIEKFFSQNDQNHQSKPFEPPSELAPLLHYRREAHILRDSILSTFTTPRSIPASVPSTTSMDRLPASESKTEDNPLPASELKPMEAKTTGTENPKAEHSAAQAGTSASETPPDSGQTEKSLPTPAQASKKGMFERATDYLYSWTPWSRGSKSVPIQQLDDVQRIIDESHAAHDLEEEKEAADELLEHEAEEAEAEEARATLEGLRERYESAKLRISKLREEIEMNDDLIQGLVSTEVAEAAKEADPDEDVPFLERLRKETEQAQQVKENLEKQLSKAQIDAQKIKALLSGRMERRKFSSTHIHSEALSASDSDVDSNDSGETDSVDSNDSGKTDSVSSAFAVKDRPSSLLHVSDLPRREKKDSPRSSELDPESDTESVDLESDMRNVVLEDLDPDRYFEDEDVLISPELRSREGHRDEVAEPDDAVSAGLRRDYPSEEVDEEAGELGVEPETGHVGAKDEQDNAEDDAASDAEVDAASAVGAAAATHAGTAAAPEATGPVDDAEGAAAADSGRRFSRIRREVDADNIIGGSHSRRSLRPIPGREVRWKPASHVFPGANLLFETSPDYISGHVEYPSDMGISEILFDVGDCESQVYPSLETQTHQPHGFWSQSDILELCVGDSHSPELLGAGFQCNDVGEVSVQVVNGMSGPVYEVNCVSDLASCMKDPQSNVGLQPLELLGGNLPPQEPVKVDGLVLFDISPIQSGFKLGSPPVNTSALSCTQADKHDFPPKDLYSGQLQTKTYHCIRDGAYDLRKVDRGEMQFRFDM